MVEADFYESLSGRPVRHRRRRSAGAVVTVIGVLMAGAATAILMRDDGDGGEPFAVASIHAKPAEPPAVAHEPVAQAPPSPAPAQRSANQDPAPGSANAAENQKIDIENGVTVVRAMPPGGSTPMTLKMPEPAPVKTGVRGPDPRLTEASASGALPRIGANGERPSSAYAAAPVSAAGRPRIAILVGGMGLDRAATEAAAADLPSAITFGFAPYGNELDQQAGRVRAAGHEIVLQMPMEDFGRGERPFPHMLKVDEPGNADRLHWLLSRFGGYAGVGNYLGGRLLADEGSLRPVLQDVAARGLYFVDDGTASRSLAVTLSPDVGLAALKADIVLDAQTDAASIDAALSRLETLAKERGFAFGTASGRPATNALIARFIIGAAKRGVVLVPISQALGTSDPVATTQAAR